MANQSKLSQPVLEARNISKDFLGIYALKNIDLQIFKGEVHAIIGENGAGKSTLMKIISGVYTEYEGEILLEGERTTFSNPKQASGKGVVIIHQELNLIPYLSITENLFLGNELTDRFGLLDYLKMHSKAKELLGRLHLDIDPRTLVHQLRIGQQQLVEIARSLLHESKVLIMDEPTSAISDHEVALLFQIIKELKAKGVAIVYISHKLNELVEIADRFTILRDGVKIGTGGMADVSNEQLIQMMVGRSLIKNTKISDSPFSGEIFRVENLHFKNPENKNEYLAENISFSLHRGEVLGLCGLMGAGRTEILEAIFGLHPKYVSGKIFVDGTEIHIRSVSDAIAAGFALVPEDRKLQGLIMNMDVTQNTSLASTKKISKYGFLSKRKEEESALHFMAKLHTQASSPSIEVQKLSGGNQQKVVIAKWLATQPKILLLDEPTRGIDVGAKSEIYQLIHELAGQGMGIVVVSSELPEILAVSDNIMVMAESRLTAKMSRAEASEEKIMKAALVEKEY